MVGRVVRRMVVVGVAALAFVPALPATVASATPPSPSLIPTADKRIFMITDSVGLGAKSAMSKVFPSPEWQLTVTGKPGLFTEQLAANYVAPAPLYQFGESAIVATGYNYPYWDPPRFDRAIDQMVNTLKGKGVQRIFWVTMREVKPQYFSGWNSLSSAYRTLYLAYPTANQQLRNAQVRHPELSIIDWAAVSDQTGLTYDAIHLNPTGAARYSSIASTAVRSGASRQAAGAITELDVASAEGVPEGATAAALNLTVVNPRMSGYLTAYPCGGDRPVVSNLNFRANENVAAATIVPIGVDGKVCVYQSTEAHIIADLNGAFAADSGFVALTPGRAVDTRATPGARLAAGATLTAHVGAIEGAPEGEFIAVMNLTVLGSSATTEVRLYPCDESPPDWPTRTVEAGRVQTLPVIRDTDAAGDVCVKVTSDAHVLVDLFGAFGTDADIHPFSLQRVDDTRFGPMPGAASVVDQQLTGSNGIPTDPLPSGAMVTVTLFAPQGIGWATAYPCAGGMPPTSIVNVVPNHVQSNAGLIPVDATGTVCVYVSVPTHVLLDVSGWAGTAFTALAPTRLVDTRAS